MKFIVIRDLAGKYNKFVIKETNSKSVIGLDIGLALEFKDKQTAKEVCDLLNKEFGGKR